MRKILFLMILCAGAMSLPAQAKPPKPDPSHPAKSHKCVPHAVGYRASGELVSVSLTQTAGAATPQRGDDRYDGSITVNVTKAGKFNVDTRIASLYTNSAFHIEVDGKNVTGSIKFLNTGSFQKWATVRKSGISLTAGKHVIKLVIDSTGGHKFAGNVNWIKFS